MLWARPLIVVIICLHDCLWDREGSAAEPCFEAIDRLVLRDLLDGHAILHFLPQGEIQRIEVRRIRGERQGWIFSLALASIATAALNPDGVVVLQQRIPTLLPPAPLQCWGDNFRV